MNVTHHRHRYAETVILLLLRNHANVTPRFPARTIAIQSQRELRTRCAMLTTITERRHGKILTRATTDPVDMTNRRKSASFRRH